MNLSQSVFMFFRRRRRQAEPRSAETAAPAVKKMKPHDVPAASYSSGAELVGWGTYDEGYVEGLSPRSLPDAV